MNNLGKKTWFLDIFSGMSVYAFTVNLVAADVSPLHFPKRC